MADLEHSLLCCEDLSSPLLDHHYNHHHHHHHQPASDDPHRNASSCFNFTIPRHHHSQYFPHYDHDFAADEDDDQQSSMPFLLNNQAQFAPDAGLLAQYSSSSAIAKARLNAVHYFIKVHVIYKFTPLTVALAVNYLDRYLSKHLHSITTWKPWMVELVSVACLSIAAKMEEVDVPTLLDLQCGGLEHLFEASVVARMEVRVLSSLRWKMRAITPFAFAEKALSRLNVSHQTKNLMLARVSELLIGILSEIEFLKFQPSVIAATSICCSLEEAAPVQAEQLKTSLLQLICLDAEEIRECYLLMEATVVDPLYPSLLSSSSSSSSLSNNLESIKMQLPLSPNAVVNIHHLENNSYLKIKQRLLVTDLHVESVPIKRPQSVDLDAVNPKRRRHN